MSINCLGYQAKPPLELVEYKLPLKARITMFFLSKQEKQQVRKKVNEINRIRNIEYKDKLEIWKKSITPHRLYIDKN